MSEIQRESSIQYFLDINSLYAKITEDIKALKNLENIISTMERKIKIKRQVFCKKNLPFVYILFVLFFVMCFIPLYKKSFLYICIPIIIGMIVCYTVVLLYKNKVLKKMEKNHKKIIMPYCEKIIEIIEDLQLCKIQYEDISCNLSDNSKHPMAIYLMYESLSNDYTTSVDDALDFYEKRYKILAQKIDKVSQEIFEEIKNSETKHRENEAEIENINKKAKKYKIQ